MSLTRMEKIRRLLAATEKYVVFEHNGQQWVKDAHWLCRTDGSLPLSVIEKHGPLVGSDISGRIILSREMPTRPMVVGDCFLSGLAGDNEAWRQTDTNPMRETYLRVCSDCVWTSDGKTAAASENGRVCCVVLLEKSRTDNQVLIDPPADEELFLSEDKLINKKIHEAEGEVSKYEIKFGDAQADVDDALAALKALKEREHTLPPPGRALAEVLKQRIRARGDSFRMSFRRFKTAHGLFVGIDGEAALMLDAWMTQTDIFKAIFGTFDADLSFNLLSSPGIEGGVWPRPMAQWEIDKLPVAERAEMACAAIDRTCDLLGLPALEVANAQ